MEVNPPGQESLEFSNNVEGSSVPSSRRGHAADSPQRFTAQQSSGLQSASRTGDTEAAVQSSLAQALQEIATAQRLATAIHAATAQDRPRGFIVQPMPGASSVSVTAFRQVSIDNARTQVSEALRQAKLHLSAAKNPHPPWNGPVTGTFANEIIDVQRRLDQLGQSLVPASASAPSSPAPASSPTSSSPAKTGSMPVPVPQPPTSVAQERGDPSGDVADNLGLYSTRVDLFNQQQAAQNAGYPPTLVQALKAKLQEVLGLLQFNSTAWTKPLDVQAVINDSTLLQKTYSRATWADALLKRNFEELRMTTEYVADELRRAQEP